MTSPGKQIVRGWRILLLALVFAGGFIFLMHALYQVQVIRGQDLNDDKSRQSVRRVQVPGLRGKIYDRQGHCLAENRPNFCIAYYVEELRQRGPWQNTIRAVDQNIDKLALELGLPRKISITTISNHVMRSLPMPLLAWRDVDEQTIARWAELSEPFPGVDLYIQPERFYPQGSVAAHVLGYVGRDKPQTLPGQKTHFYLPETIGKSGVEYFYNSLLTGTTGGRQIIVDARGYKHQVIEGESPLTGQDLHLTLDLELQHKLESLLRPHQGAGIVIDPRNGEILAMASMPNFDPNRFIPTISHKEWQSLNDDARFPLLNRVTQGRFAPGSTFKPVTAMAALKHQPTYFHEDYDCHGVFVLGNMRLRCWDTYGHGPLDLHRALAQSCNAYFCHMANEIGYPPIYQEALQLGLGNKTGIDLPFESQGLLPTEEWKEHNLKDVWRPGDTCQIAIGQGLLLTTPLQMAMVCASLANRGHVYRPHLRKSLAPPELVRKLQWPEKAIKLVREGMLDVVEVGTGRRVKLRGTRIAAKTGTAELDIRGVRHKNAWMIAFGPFEDPTLAVAIIVENGESGGLTVAPMIHEIFKARFGELPLDEHRLQAPHDTLNNQPIRGD